MTTKIIQLNPIFFDTDGTPVDKGYIYIGHAGLTAEGNPIDVFWDEAGTIPATQPIRTINGYPSRSGNSAAIYTPFSEHSMIIKDKHEVLISSELVVQSDQYSQWAKFFSAEYVSETSYKYVGVDKTTDLSANRMVKIGGSGDRYANIVSYSFSTDTIVVVDNIFDSSGAPSTLHSAINIASISISDPQRYSNRVDQVYSGKSQVITTTPIPGSKITILGRDGGDFIAQISDTAGTYIDNGEDYCGTIIVPSGGDGSTAWTRTDKSIGFKEFGALGDGSEDGPQMQAAINYASQQSIELNIDGDTYYTAGTLYLKYDAANNPGHAVSGGRYSIRGTGRGEYANIIGEVYKRTTIIADGGVDGSTTDTTGTGLRELTLADLSIVSDIASATLDTSGAFKSSFHHLTIKNNHTDGSGWKNQNNDQNDVSKILIIGLQNPSIASGIGCDLSSDKSVIDGSVGVFSQILVRGFKYGYRFGLENDADVTGNGQVDGNFQSFNSYTSLASLNIEVGAIFGDRLRGNTFNACQFRGSRTGARLGSSASENSFIECGFNSYGASTATEALYLGYGSTVAGRAADNNRFSRCRFDSARDSAPGVRWATGIGATMTFGNIIEDCVIAGVGSAILAEGITFTSGMFDDANTGQISDITFENVTKEYSKSNTYGIKKTPINLPYETTFTSVTTTAAGTVTAATIPIRDGDVVSVSATITANDMVNNVSNASYLLHGGFMSTSGVASKLGGSYTALSVLKNDAGLGATLDVSRGNMRVRVVGVLATITWTVKLDIIRA